MSNPKLLEEIEELEQQKVAIEAALLQMRQTYSALNPNQSEDPYSGLDLEEEVLVVRRSLGGSYVDEAVMAVTEKGRALHMRDILQHIKAKRGTMPTRASVESSLTGEMKAARKQGRRPRIVKVSPRTFDIPNASALSVAS